MVWEVVFHPAFEREFDSLSSEVQDELLAQAKVLETFGPTLGRPRADTLGGARHTNLKELRFDAANGVWRVAFAFDPKRRAVLLAAGNKSGMSERRFYRQLIGKADARLDAHLARFGEERRSR